MSGTIVNRGGRVVRVEPAGFGAAIARVEGLGSGRAVLSGFSGVPKEVWLDNSDMARIQHLGGGTINVYAIAGTIEVMKQLQTYTVSATTPLNQSITLGSPFSASANNTEPIVLALTDPAGAPFGSIVLDPGESVDVDFVLGSTRQDDRATITVLAGSVPITILGWTTQLTAGQTLAPPTTNRPPTAVAGGPYLVNEASMLTLNGAGSSDPNQPAGTLAYAWDLNFDGVTFDVDATGATPAVSFADNFSSRMIALRVTDSGGLESIATTSLQVDNVVPTATPDSFFTPQATAISGNVLSDGIADSDPAGATDPLSVSGFTIPANGTLVLNANGSFGYTPDSTFYGTDSFAYTINDGDGGLATATVTINVAPAAPGSILTIPDTCLGGTALLIIGTSGNDTILVEPGTTSTSLNVLFNSALTAISRPSGRIIVTGGAGEDNLQVAGSITNQAWEYGGAGHDRLKGGAGHDTLHGGEGDDLLVGGSGRDLLIGGTGADRIVGNADDDIIVAGTTVHDARGAALCAIMDEWTRTDRTYEQRITNLTNGGGNNGSVKLVNSGTNRTVFDDNSIDVLTGSSGLDWFFFDAERDRATDLSDEAFAGDLDFILS